MAIPISGKTVIATYHHARQSDLDPTPTELRAWNDILQSSYERVLPTEMVRHNLDPTNPALVDLALLLAELTHENGIIARARRGCAVVAGLMRTTPSVVEDAQAVLAIRATRSARGARKTSRRRRKPA